jgi:competence protein ComEC
VNAVAGTDRAPTETKGLDLRMPAVAAAAWAGTLVAGTPARWTICSAVLAVLVGVGCGARWGLRARPTLLAAGVVVGYLAAGQITAIRAHHLDHGSVHELADRRAQVTVTGTVTSDPRVLAGGWGDRTVWRVSVRSVIHNGRGVALRRPLLVFADGSTGPELGAAVQLVGRLKPSDDRDVAAVLIVTRPPEHLADPGVWWRASGVLRASIRDAVRDRPTVPRALVPALVDGDDAGIPETVAEDFRETGLTHLLAVSGTNLTLMIGVLVASARWCRVRGRGLAVVGALGIVGFVLLARTEPSVLRAAVMGAVGLMGLGSGTRARGLRVLAAAVVALLLVDPGLARSVGFVLSVLATAGILVLAAPLRDALASWLPRWLAEAIAVPFAAQLACTPVIAAISGRVSLVAVGANMMAAPVVGPATVLGLAGGLVGLVSAPVGRLLAWPASWCVAWIAEVAERGADLPTPAITWGTSVPALILLSVVTLVIAWSALRAFRRPVVSISTAVVLIAVVLVRPGALGWPAGQWPPSGWILVACDVGQGDALVLSAGPGSAVVIDAGPDPTLVDRCLDRLEVARVPLVVLTHFHADHVDGLPGVLAGRRVSAVEVTSTLDPPGGVREVLAAAGEQALTPTYAGSGVARTYGPTTIQTLWPARRPPTTGAGDGSSANDASVVVLAESGGVRMLLTGDIEPLSQGRLAQAYPGLEVDVLKVPHHGSRYQDLDWLESLRAEVLLVSVGAENDYGHPASSTMERFGGAQVARTDVHGDLAVVVRHGRPVVVTR